MNCTVDGLREWVTRLRENKNLDGRKYQGTMKVDRKEEMKTNEKCFGEDDVGEMDGVD